MFPCKFGCKIIKNCKITMLDNELKNSRHGQKTLSRYGFLNLLPLHPYFLPSFPNFFS